MPSIVLQLAFIFTPGLMWDQGYALSWQVLVIHSEEAQEVVNSQPSLPIIFILTMKMIRRAANRKILKRGLRLFGDPFFPMTQHPSDINNEVICI